MVRRSRRDDLAWAADLAAKLRISLLAFMISGALLSAAYYDIDYLIICLLAAVRRIVAREVTELVSEERRTVQPASRRGARQLEAARIATQG